MEEEILIGLFRWDEDEDEEGDDDGKAITRNVPEVFSRKECKKNNRLDSIINNI